MTLSDGRALGFIEIGSAQGSPIFHFNGHGNSRLEVLLVAEAATKAGVRLIGVDRPGIGLSDPKKGFQILDWPDQVEQLANHLGIENFAVTGYSAGGAFALACALKLPHRLTSCGLICSAVPSTHTAQDSIWILRGLWRLGKLPPAFLRAYIRFMRFLIIPANDNASMDKLIRKVSRDWPKTDRALLEDVETRRLLLSIISEGLKQGSNGNVEEGILLARPWGFDLKDVAFERLFLWHGEADPIIPVSGTRKMVIDLPKSKAVFYPEHGHLSTFLYHASEIFRTLTTDP